VITGYRGLMVRRAVLRRSAVWRLSIRSVSRHHRIGTTPGLLVVHGCAGGSAWPQASPGMPGARRAVVMCHPRWQARPPPI